MPWFKHLSTLILPLVFIACDPVHELRVENQTTIPVEMIYHPNNVNRPLVDKPVEITVIEGQEMSRITLQPGEDVNIGMVVARYTPSAQDINLEYLELRYGPDTIRLKGRNAILSAIQQVDDQDWRMIIK